MISKIEVEKNIFVTVNYEYVPFRWSNDFNLPDDRPEVANCIITDIEGSVDDFINFVESKDGKFWDWLENKLLESNE